MELGVLLEVYDKFMVEFVENKNSLSAMNILLVETEDQVEEPAVKLLYDSIDDLIKFSRLFYCSKKLVQKKKLIVRKKLIFDIKKL